MTTVKNDIFIWLSAENFYSVGGGGGVRIDFWWGGNKNLMGKVYWGGWEFFQLGENEQIFS